MKNNHHILKLGPSTAHQAAVDLTNSIKARVYEWRNLTRGSRRHRTARATLFSAAAYREFFIEHSFAVLLLLLFVTPALAADTNTVGAAPGRFQLYSANVMYDDQLQPALVRLDTATGRTWVHAALRVPASATNTAGERINIYLRRDVWYEVEEDGK